MTDPLSLAKKHLANAIACKKLMDDGDAEYRERYLDELYNALAEVRLAISSVRGEG